MICMHSIFQYDRNKATTIRKLTKMILEWTRDRDSERKNKSDFTYPTEILIKCRASHTVRRTDWCIFLGIFEFFMNIWDGKASLEMRHLTDLWVYYYIACEMSRYSQYVYIHLWVCMYLCESYAPIVYISDADCAPHQF